MYLRETRRRNADGSEVCYVALAHNERDKDTGVSKPRVIHNFGRADQLDRAALARLVCSLSRFLEPAQAMAASMPGEVEILEARPMGTAYVADQLWSRLGIGAAIRRVAAGESARRVDPVQVERVIFAMVANRLSPTPLSKLAGAAWVSNRVFIDGLPALCDDACYPGMDFLLDALPVLQEEVFFSVANLLNLEVDLLFFDGLSTYWERDSADGELLHDPDVDPEPAGDGERPGAHEAGDGQVSTDGGEAGWPVEAATRRYGRSKDHRGDLPQVVIGLAVTREGIPVRLWTFPGDTPPSSCCCARSRTTYGPGISTGSSGCSTAGSPRRPTGGICSAVVGTTSWVRSCAAPAPKRPRCCPGRAASSRWPGTCGSKRSASTTAPPGTGS